MRMTWRNIGFAAFWLYVVFMTTYGTFGLLLWLGASGGLTAIVSMIVFGVVAQAVGERPPPDGYRPKTR